MDTASIKGRCRKLSPTWKGPGIVTNKLSSFLYKVKVRGETSTMNHDRLKLCTDEYVPKWIQKNLRALENSSQISDTEPGKYCICRGPDKGTFMIQCFECKEWFHGSCVNINAEEAKNIDIYECPQCTV